MPRPYDSRRTTRLAGTGTEFLPVRSQVGGGTSTNLHGQTTPVYLLNTCYANGDYGLIVSIPATGVLLEQTLERAVAPYRPTYKLAIDEIIPVAPRATRWHLPLRALLRRHPHDHIA